MYAKRIKEFTDTFYRLSNIYSKENVFTDFVKMSAISIYNLFAKNENMEKEYLKIINSYRKEDQQLFLNMFTNLIMAYEETDEITDLLGTFYEKENLSNGHLGQFFTPSHISDLMSEIIFENENVFKKKLEEKGFIRMAEPTCRSRRIDTFFC